MAINNYENTHYNFLLILQAFKCLISDPSLKLQKWNLKHNYFILHLKFFKKYNTKLIQKKYHSISRFLIQKVTYDAMASAFQIVICKVDLHVSYVTYLSSNPTRHLHYY